MSSIDELLISVQKPARYIGGEWNAVKKEWTEDKIKVLLAFPDIYEIGMSYLGTKILYGILNGRSDCLCERVYSPWTDLEAALRKDKKSLFSLESRKPLGAFDIIGITIAYELSYTNVLNILDLGGIPLKASGRGDRDPLVICGGPSSFNPEPMADFIDAFVIGDGEEAVGEIVDAYKEFRLRAPGSKPDLLKRLAKIKGVYVPSLYNVEYNPDNTIKRFFPNAEEAPPVVAKRIVDDLDAAFYPAEQIVPYIQIVHDRIAIEIMRGCRHACRFCQASAVYRPVRERSKGKIVELAKAAYDATGYDEISLLSLSSGDHSEIKETIADLNSEFEKKAVSISVPSLRVEDILKDLPGLISVVRKAGLTFAPEAGSECLRRAINKDIDMEKLYQAVLESFKAGWNRVKLYFMIGLPEEEDDDIVNIADLLGRVSNLRKEVGMRPAFVNASINAFVPKPHTPFQRNGMERRDILERKRSLLKKSVSSKNIELNFHSFDMSYLEAVFSRGDRRLSETVLEAWRSGCRFDGWRESFSMSRWAAAFEKTGLDPDFYVHRPRQADEILPWSFIGTVMAKGNDLKDKGRS